MLAPWKKSYDQSAAAAAKSRQSCPTLCDPIDGSPPGSPVPGILQARTLEWVAISFSNAWKWKVKVKLLSHVRLDSILKSRDIINKSLHSQSYGFSGSHVWMWELDYKESWALKNWCFEQWCWRRLLRVPWTARRSNQSILKEISPEYSFGGLMLKLKL